MAEELDLQQVQITVEQILAAVLNKVGIVVMDKDDLVADYSNFAVAVDPIGEGELQFALVEVGDLDAVSE
jgi:hypothetical protein